MRDNLCVNQVSYGDLVAIKNDVREEIEEIDDFYNDKLNSCAIDLQKLFNKINLLEQGLVNHNAKWARQEIINENQQDIIDRLKGQELSTFFNDNNVKVLKEKTARLEKQVFFQNIIISAIICAVPIYVLNKKFR